MKIEISEKTASDLREWMLPGESYEDAIRRMIKHHDYISKTSTLV